MAFHHCVPEMAHQTDLLAVGVANPQRAEAGGALMKLKRFLLRYYPPGIILVRLWSSAVLASRVALPTPTGPCLSARAPAGI